MTAAQQHYYLSIDFSSHKVYEKTDCNTIIYWSTPFFSTLALTLTCLLDQLQHSSTIICPLTSPAIRYMKKLTAAQFFGPQHCMTAAQQHY